MGRPRVYDHNECRRLYAAGWSKSALARRYGVSFPSISYAVDAAYRARHKAWKQRRFEEFGRNIYQYDMCPECGGEKRTVAKRCQECHMAEAHTAINDNGEVRCNRCREYKDPSAFRMYERAVSRGLLFYWCRSCETAHKRDYRARKAAAVSTLRA